MSATLVARLLSLTVAALLAACGTEETTVANSSTGISASQVSANNANLELDLSCDTATYPSAALLQCELGNVARTLEANIEQLMPAFVSRELQQSATNIQAVLQRSAQDPSWNLPPAIGNSPVTPLCAAGAGPCVGDPFRYPGVNGPDGDAFYTQEAEVTPVVYYDQGCARISGQVWKPRTTGNSTLPAVIIKNGSVQANEALYWWAAQALVRAGYMVLTFDQRSQGRSDTLGARGEIGSNIDPSVYGIAYVFQF